MKKNFLFVLAAALMMAACSKQESIESTPAIPTAKTSMSNMRSYEEALRIAENAIGMLEDSKSSTRSTEKCRKINLSENKVIMRDAKTRGESGASDSLIYVFNFENNEGFALVSASKNTEGLLAVTEQGHCDPTTLSGIEGFDMFVDMAKEYVLAGMNSGSFEEIKDSTVYQSIYEKGPLVSVKWGQNKAEGEFCRNKKAGCANTAMAQIMSYYEYPTSIILTYNNNNNINLIWNKIKSHSTEHLSTCCSDLSTHHSISHLLRELGKRDWSYYYTKEETNGGKAYTRTDIETYAKPTFENLGYSFKDFRDYDGSFVRNELLNNHIILISGELADETGHAWIIDGYRRELGTVFEMKKTNNSGWEYTGVSYPFDNNYNHFNWGWYGINNGYFLEGVYNTLNAYIYDDNKNYYNYNFRYSVRVASVYHN